MDFSCKLLIYIVSLCDNYCKINHNHDLIRFFKMIRLLPLEMEKIICNRVYGNKKNMISVSRVNRSMKYILKNNLFV